MKMKYIDTMKKLILVTILITSFFCEQTPPEIPVELIPEINTVIQPVPTSAPVVVNPPATVTPAPTTPIVNVKTLALTAADGLKFYDTFDILPYSSWVSHFSGFRQASIDNTLNDFDAYGNIVTSYALPAAPSKIITNGTSIWTFENIGTNQTRVWLNYSEYGNYINNNWQVQNVYKSLLNDIIVEKVCCGYIDVTGQLTAVQYANNEGLVIHNYDGVNRTASFRIENGYAISWGMNYFVQAKNWQRVNGKWYSANGYTFDTVNGLVEGQISTWDFNFYPNAIGTIYLENPVLINAGVRGTDIFWIECNTGKLVKYNTLNNIYSIVGQLYQGDNLRATGQNLAKTMKPVIVGDYLYFNWQGSVYRYSFTGGMVFTFHVGEAEVRGW